MKHPVRKKNLPLLITVLEKGEKLSFSQRSGLSNFCVVFKSKFGVKTPLNKNIFETFQFKNLPISVMSLEMTKNLKNTSLSMLSGFLDSNFCIRICFGDNNKHVNTPPTYYYCRSHGCLRVNLVKFC